MAAAQDEGAGSADPFYAPPRAPVADGVTDESNIRVEYELTRMDILLFTLQHQFTALPTYLTPLILGMVGGFALGKRGFYEIGFFALTCVPAMMLAQLFIVCYGFIVRGGKTLFAPHTIEIRDIGFYEETPFNRALYFWRGGMHRVVDRLGYVAVYPTPILLHIIPNRAFSTALHRASFVATLRRHMDANKPVE